VTPEARERLLERAYAAFNAADSEARRDIWSEDIVFRPVDGWPGPQEYHGHDGLWQFRKDWFGTWDDAVVEAGRPEHLGDEQALIAVCARGRAQGTEFELPFWQLARFRGECIAWVGNFLDEDEARAEARSA
jgi:ketosteroid isomerase-like protein